jgi:uncharacterized protein
VNILPTEFPLLQASERGQIDKVEALLEAGAEVDIRGYIGCTPFSKACFHGHLEIAKRLYQAGAELHQADDFGYTPLFWSIAAGQLSVVAWLVEQGADFLRPALDGQTPLKRAASGCFSKNSTQILTYLLGKGAAPNHCDSMGNQNSLLMSASQGGPKELIQLLLDAGAKVNTHSHSGNTALILACDYIHDQAELVSLLLQAGADLQAKDPLTGCDLVTLAASHGSVGCIKVLLEAGLTSQGKSHYNPLITAIKNGSSSTAIYLIEQEADCNPQGFETSPLMEALARRQYQVAWALLKGGAHPLAENAEGSVLLWALGCQDDRLYERSRPPHISTPFILELLKQGAGKTIPEMDHALILAKHKCLKQVAISLAKKLTQLKKSVQVS